MELSAIESAILEQQLKRHPDEPGFNETAVRGALADRWSVDEINAGLDSLESRQLIEISDGGEIQTTMTGWYVLGHLVRTGNDAEGAAAG